jgi:hypothetical protein
MYQYGLALGKRRQFGPSATSFEQNRLKDPESDKSKELGIVGIIKKLP